MTRSIEAALNGDVLYGDDFGPEEIEAWFREEEEGYFQLPGSSLTQGQDYGYNELNRRHGFRRIADERFPVCLAIGCGSGRDIEPIAPQVDRFVCVEPARKWWREEIGGTPAEYVAPDPLGTLDLPDRSVDLAISFGVLHHIPNVSHVFGEVARTLKPGGKFILREPISWMGDWRKSRRGLTRNERGIPVKLLRRMAETSGLKQRGFSYCMTNALLILARKLGYAQHYNNPAFVALDAALSAALSVNARYRRDSFVSRIAPSSVFAVYEKAG